MEKIIKEAEEKVKFFFPNWKGDTSSVPYLIFSTMRDLITKSYEAGRDEREREFEEEAIESAHLTEQGWCCACSADVAFLNGKIEDAEKETRQKLREELLKALPDECINADSVSIEEMRKTEKHYATKDFSIGWNDYRGEITEIIKTLLK